MTEADLEAKAKDLYESMPTPKPRWDQLGSVTKSVWRDKVLEYMEPVSD